MNSNTRGQVVVIAGPAGTGKNSIIQGVLDRVKNSADLITSTTRTPRQGEKDGVDYYFLTNQEFAKNLESGKVLEYYHRTDTDTWYGTLKDSLEEQLSKNDLVLGDLQIVGAKALKQNYNSINIFVLPETDEVMERRIRGRNIMSDQEWQERLKHTKRELEEDLPFYDYKIYNPEGKLNQTVETVLEILKKEGIKFELK
jgi:guanylate kinase